MRYTTLVWWAAVLGVLCGVQPCAAGLISTFSLGAPTLENPTTQYPGGSVVAFNVYVTMNSGVQITNLYLDVTASSSALSPGGNYSAWTFTPNSTISNTTYWVSTTVNYGPGGFANSMFPGQVYYADQETTVMHGLATTGSPELLGTLTYNLATFNVTSSSSLTASIMATGSQYVDPSYDPQGYATLVGYVTSSPPTFDYATPAFTSGSQAFPSGGSGPPTVPTPSGLVLAGIGGALLIVAGLVRRDRGRSLKPAL